MYVVKIMKSGYALRISLPRLLQRHLGVRAGDVLILRPIDGGGFRAEKFTLTEVKGGGVQGSTVDVD